MRYVIAITALMWASAAPAKNYFKDKPDFIAQNLRQNSYSIDSSAGAVVLYEHYTYDLTAPNNVLIYRVRRIIKILNKDGMKYADVSVPIYRSNKHFSKIMKVSGTTYNLDNDKITEQELDKASIYKGAYEHIKEKKFSMPAVHEGSIVDYSYDIEEDITRGFGDWSIQRDIPKLYSELELLWPNRFSIALLQQAAPNFKSVGDDEDDKVLPDAYTYDLVAGNSMSRKVWVRKNIAAIATEPYVYDVDNYKEEVHFYIKGVATATGVNMISDTWQKVNKDLLESGEFYKVLFVDYNDVSDKAFELVKEETDKVERAKKIFTFVRDSVTMQGYHTIWIDNDPATVLKNRTGNVTEINMLLISMLRNVGIDCSPVVLSLRHNGKVTSLYPDLRRFDYTVCELRINDDTSYIDASVRCNPFGVLPEACYNGFAWVVDSKGYEISLEPNMIKGRTFFSATTINDSVDNYIINCKLLFSQFDAMRHREAWGKDTSLARKYIADLLKKTLSGTLKNFEIKNLEDPQKPLVLEYDEQIDWGHDAGKVYFSPYFFHYFNENPFKSEGRRYPVELPCTYNIGYSCKLKLPQGYVLDDSVTSVKIKDEDRLQSMNILAYDTASNTLTVNSSTAISTTYFPAEDYAEIKDFFEQMLEEQHKNYVIKKQPK